MDAKKNSRSGCKELILFNEGKYSKEIWNRQEPIIHIAYNIVIDRDILDLSWNG